MIIAVDGPSAAGKGTLARALAGRLGFAHLDSGMIYRAVAAMIDVAEDDPGFAGAALRAAEALSAADLQRPGLRGERIGHLASKVAIIPEVRAALLAFQRDFAARPPGGAPGAVLAGRRGPGPSGGPHPPRPQRRRPPGRRPCLPGGRSP